MFRSLQSPAVLAITLAGAGILMVTMGIRQSFGLFIDPISIDTGLGIATISFALAIGQFVWGAVQPVAGVLADRYGPDKVLIGGAILLSVGLALTPYISSGFGLGVSIGLLASMGSGAGSFSVLIGAAAQRLPLQSRAEASGVINAGGSFGQFVFAPIIQKLIQSIGWVGTLWALAIAALATLPLIRHLSPKEGYTPPPVEDSPPLGQLLRGAVRNPSYLLLNLGFFTCGFHIAFLVTHLPGEVRLCGLPPTVASWSLAIIGLANIVGSLLAGWLTSLYPGKYVLFAMYASRALLIGIYLMMPPTALTFYLFAAGLGLTWLATVPPTASIVGTLYGTRYLATLFGITLLSHQIGGFLGAWLGGLAISQFGSYTWMWYADAALALMAALVNLPIREKPVEHAPLAAS